tara:strand:- start:4959 stop:5144 length:186 start_codon:yes stop_codon:yes gene_type:complete
MRPISSELAHLWITGDGKKFLNREEARNWQKHLETEERRKRFERKKLEMLRMRESTPTKQL